MNYIACHLFFMGRYAFNQFLRFGNEPRPCLNHY